MERGRSRGVNRQFLQSTGPIGLAPVCGQTWKHNGTKELGKKGDTTPTDQELRSVLTASFALLS